MPNNEQVVELYNPSKRLVKVDATRVPELLKRGFTRSKEGVVSSVEKIPKGKVYLIENKSGHRTHVNADVIRGAIKRGSRLLMVDDTYVCKDYEQECAPTQESKDDANLSAKQDDTSANAGDSAEDDAQSATTSEDDAVQKLIDDQAAQDAIESVARSLNDMSADELYKKAKDEGLSVTRKMNKSDLISVLSQA